MILPKQMWSKIEETQNKKEPQGSNLPLKLVYTSSISNNIKNLKTFPDADVLGFNLEDITTPIDTKVYLEK